MRKPLHTQSFELRSVLMLLISELVFLLIFSALGLWVILHAGK